MHVDDVSEAIMCALLSINKLKRFKYYMGTGKSTSLLDAFSLQKHCINKLGTGKFQFLRLTIA